MSKRTRGRRWPIALAVIVVMVGGGAVAVWQLDLLPRRRSVATESPAERMETAVVTESVVSDVIEVSGNIEVSTKAELAFGTGGEVESLYIEPGQGATANALLAELDKDAAEFNLASTQLQLEEARVSGNTRQAELLELDVALKRDAVEEHELRAPFAGVASRVFVEVGDHVTAGQPVVRLVDRSSLTAVLEVDEIDMPEVDVGREVRFTFDAVPETPYSGVVSYIPVEGRVTSQGFAVFDVEAEIPDPPQTLLPGYSFVAEIVVQGERRVVTVPERAVVDRDGSTLVLVRNSAGDTPRPRQVRLGATLDQDVEVLSGVEPGETVIIPPSTARSEGGGGFGLFGRGLAPPRGGLPGGLPGGPRRGGGAAGAEQRDAAPDDSSPGGGQ